jgi:hypothetical protein
MNRFNIQAFYRTKDFDGNQTDFIGIIINKANQSNQSLNLFRKEKAKKEYDNGSGWFKQEIRKNLKIKNSNGRGVQGYYYNKSLNKWVWLRSSFEYIFAEYLTENGMVWDFEVETYCLPNGKKYTPDFFIYDEKNNLKAIVEIKGYLTINSYKTEELKSIINAEISLINNISLYKLKNIDYLKQWKKLRVLELPE